MNAQPSADCPICGEPYAERVVVERGLQWDDLYPGTPFDFFDRYRRRCSAAYDVERDRPVDDGEQVAYFHEGRGRTGAF